MNFVSPTAVCLFRLLPGVDTRPIKYMHGFLHMFVIYLIYYSMYNEKRIEWPYLHGFPAWITFYCYGAQVIYQNKSIFFTFLTVLDHFRFNNIFCFTRWWCTRFFRKITLCNWCLVISMLCLCCHYGLA